MSTAPWSFSTTPASARPPHEPGLNYLCPGFKAFFHHVDAPMRRMCGLLREGRPPSEIVAEYRVGEDRADGAQA